MFDSMTIFADPTDKATDLAMSIESAQIAAATAGIRRDYLVAYIDPNGCLCSFPFSGTPSGVIDELEGLGVNFEPNADGAITARYARSWTGLSNTRDVHGTDEEMTRHAVTLANVAPAI